MVACHPSSSKRVFPRVEQQLAVRFELQGVPRQGQTHTLSQTGLMVLSETLPEVGEALTVMLRLPSTKEVSLQGRVASLRSEPSLGFGFEFSALNETYSAFLRLLHSARMRRTK